MTAPQAVLDLVKRFEEHLEEYLSGGYNETHPYHQRPTRHIKRTETT